MKRSMTLISIVSSIAIVPAVAGEPVEGLALPLACSGGEPFWGLTIKDANNATFTWDNEPTAWKVKGVSRAMGRITTWRVTFEGKNRYAFIFDEGQQSCSDSDGDAPLAYGIILQDGEGLLRGCCNPKE